MAYVRGTIRIIIKGKRKSSDKSKRSYVIESVGNFPNNYRTKFPGSCCENYFLLYFMIEKIMQKDRGVCTMMRNKNWKKLWILVVLAVFIICTVSSCGGTGNIQQDSAQNEIAQGSISENEEENLQMPDDTPEQDNAQAEDDALEQDNTEETEYILPDSDTRRIAESDLETLSEEELRLARNEIYARRGRKFDDESLTNYFESKSWYRGTIEPSDFTDELLSEIEKYNATFIAEYESSLENETTGSVSQNENSADQNDSDEPGNISESGYTAEGGSPDGIKCSECNGLGHCTECEGGLCPSCGGTGQTLCTSCAGLGHCLFCGGMGYSYSGVGLSFSKDTCIMCYGSGRCSRCGNNRLIRCSKCGGSGKCSKCYGLYYCSHCAGQGYYY